MRVDMPVGDLFLISPLKLFNPIPSFFYWYPATNPGVILCELSFGVSIMHRNRLAFSPLHHGLGRFFTKTWTGSGGGDRFFVLSYLAKVALPIMAKFIVPIKVGEVIVHRCWQYVPRKLSTPKRILHEVSFGLTCRFARPLLHAHEH